MQQIRRAEKDLIFAEFKDRKGDIVSGVVGVSTVPMSRSISANTRRSFPIGSASHRGIPDR